MPLLRRHLTLLRRLLVAWVIAGLVLQPVLAAFGDLHALEHLSDASSEHALDHHHDHDHGDRPAGDGQDGDPGHAVSVLHGILHSCAGMNSATLPDLPAFACAGPSDSDPPRVAIDRGPVANPPDSPFRPPIA